MIKAAYHSLKQTALRIDLPYLMDGGFWLTASQVVSMISLLILSYIFANYVDPTDYGFYKYILSLAILFGTFSLTGATQSIMQAASRNYAAFTRICFKKSLQYGLIVSGIATIASLYYFINQNIPIAIGCLLVALCKPLINSGQLVFSHLIGLKQFKTLAKLQALRVTITSAVLIGTIFYTQDILFVVAAYFISEAVVSMLLYFYATQKIPHTTDTHESDQHKFLSYAKHTSVRNILTGLAHELDKILVFQKFGAVELAVYAFAIAIPEQLKGFIKNVAILVLVKFTGYNMDSIKKDFFKKVILLGLLLILATFVYIFSVPYVYTALFPSYFDSIFLSQLFALSFPAMIAVLPVSALHSQMRERDLHSLSIVNAVLLVLSVYIGATYYGLIGLVIGRVLVRYIHCIMAFMLMYSRQTK
ncbi:MAG: O-antigen/teichoic acid export membrane protein [Candidatus Azotimanducaceae bacterium]|jgi:O-antigen/teichoic acid export membrane protein